MQIYINSQFFVDTTIINGTTELSSISYVNHKHSNIIPVFNSQKYHWQYDVIQKLIEDANKKK